MKPTQIAILALAACAPTQGSSAVLALGYGSNATGGSTPCHFSDLPTFRACLGNGGQIAIADVVMTVDPGQERLHVGPNTTLDGRGRLTISPSGYGLEVTVRNVIIRNTYFTGPGAGHAFYPVKTANTSCIATMPPKLPRRCPMGIQIHGQAKDVWIDHNTFANFGQGGVTIFDGGPEYIVDRPDMITISSNIFRSSFYAGGTGIYQFANPWPSPGHVTYYGNFFDHVFRRSPKAAGPYYVHVFNNYYRAWGGSTYFPGYPISGCNHGFAAMVTAGGQMLLENNVAEAGPCPELIINDPYVSAAGTHLGAGKIRAVGNLALKGATITGADSVDFKPSYPYKLLPATQVKASVLANAGVSHDAGVRARQ